MPNCLFCNIVNHKLKAHILYENKYLIAVLDAFPVDVGHTLIISKECQPNILKLSENAAKAIILAEKKITALLVEKLLPKGFNFVNNYNEIAGQQINHYHLHIIPKFKKEEGYKGIHQKLTKKINLLEVWKKIQK